MKNSIEKSFPLFLFIISILIYFITANPGLGFTDSGELASVCVLLGIAHPTGYPLFTLLGHIWTFIPHSVPLIQILNYFAGFLTSLSAVFFYFALLELFKILDFNNANQDEEKNSNKWLALISGFIYAFALTVWGQAGAIEVYPLHILFINIILLFFLKSFNSKGKREHYLLLTAFLLGLSFTNHLTTVLLLPAILLLFLYPPNQEFLINKNKFQFLLLLIIPFVLSLTLYLFLPIRSSTLPDMNWGWVHRGLDKFLYHVQGKQYQVWMFSGENVSVNIGKYFAALPMQLGLIGLIPMLIGFYSTYKKSKQIFWFLTALVLVCFFYSINYSIHDIESYFLTSYIALIFFSAAGLKFLYEKNKKLLPLFAIIPIISLVLNFESNNNSSDYLVNDYTDNLVNNLEEDAIVISSQWDYWCSAFWYKQKVEGLRKDVTLVEMELLRRTWFGPQLNEWYPKVMGNSKQEMEAFLSELEVFESNGNYNPNLLQDRYEKLINSIIDKNFDNHPIYLTLDVIEKEQNIAKNYEKIPVGFAFKLEKDKQTRQIDLSKIKLDRFANSMKNNTSNHLITGIKDIAVLNLVNIARYGLFTNQIDKTKEAINIAKKINPKNELIMQVEQQLK
ncbi:MAG TPA: DUF2723 domain-containing protein [Candidatus Kapabacteria bacterium]|nr:DUF2723 domain-containing protein [Candidatus Kapabacteria bacterium]